MCDNIFPFGFWNVLPATKFGTEGVKDWADFGSTLTMTGFYDLSPDKDEMLAILDECHAKGIRMIFCDRRIVFNSLHDAGFEETMRQDIKDFASHPAIFGFYLGDEPLDNQMEDVIETVRFFKGLCPDKQPFINLLPWVPWLNYNGNDTGLIAADKENYKEHLIDFVKRTGVEILSFDCYTQMSIYPDNSPMEKGIDIYFKNLLMFQEAAAETGAELWLTTLATGHAGVRCPTQDDIRWEISTAAAHGVKSLFYWYMYSETYNINYRLHPINQLNERTDTFKFISTENRIFQMVYGSVFRELSLEKAYHTLKAYGGFPLLEEDCDYFIRDVYNGESAPMIVSRFSRKSDPEKTYYALVNGSQRGYASAYVKFTRPVEIFGVQSEDGGINVWSNGFKDKDNDLHFWFSPGQIWVFAVQEKL